jgi:ferredoxin
VSSIPLQQFTASDWSSALEAILPDIHEVDRDATRIWFSFFPLALADAYETAADAQAVTRRLRLQGHARLVDGQIDSSHRFLYGHRYWPIAKGAVITRADRDAQSPSAARDLVGIVRDVIADVAAAAHVDRPLVSGIAFVALMTLRQVGLDALRASESTPRSESPDGHARSARALSPDKIVTARARDDGRGPLGFLRSTRRFSVVFDEQQADARFPVLDSQHLATAAAADTRDYMKGPRHFQEGPIPAQCRSATCGTCWVGVLGGREKLNEVEPYEARRLREFGYIEPQEAHPLIRLACQARASGNVTIVIPPWHGFVSRLKVADGSPALVGADR